MSKMSTSLLASSIYWTDSRGSINRHVGLNLKDQTPSKVIRWTNPLFMDDLRDLRISVVSRNQNLRVFIFVIQDLIPYILFNRQTKTLNGKFLSFYGKKKKLEKGKVTTLCLHYRSRSCQYNLETLPLASLTLTASFFSHHHSQECNSQTEESESYDPLEDILFLYRQVKTQGNNIVGFEYCTVY